MDKKEGVSVQEIENFAKKYKIQLFFSLAFVLACFFSYVFFSPGWSMFLAAAGGILGIVFPTHVEKLVSKAFHFVGKQEKITQIVLGVVYLVLAVFVPFVIFFTLGIMGAMGISAHSTKLDNLPPQGGE